MTDRSTVEISSRPSLKQGNVLSVSKFSNLLDDINRVLVQEGVGVCYRSISIGTWVTDLPSAYCFHCNSADGCHL